MKCLYVTDRLAIGDRRFQDLLDELRGATGLSVELREKRAGDGEMLRWARTAREKLGPAVPLSINRRLDVAIAAGADGVHLPADGLPLARVRSAAPRGLALGVSTHSAAEATRAIADGADVVVVGPIFETPSKTGFGAPLGPAALAELPPRDTHRADVFAIGGIDERGVEALAAYRDRLSGVAVIRLLQEAADPRAVVERIARR